MPLLAEMVVGGYVGMQSHPVEGLVIYNYTHRAQYDRVWNSVTRQCRGLIVDAGGEIVARPWPKFFNYGEHEQPVRYDLATHRKVYPPSDLHHALDLDAEITARDKLDGSLGILYPTSTYQPGNRVRDCAIATRGSFTSEQALRGTELLHQKYGGFVPLPGITYLFEIIYPENRIVLDYGQEEKLVLLGIVDTETGETEYGDIIWPGEFADFLHARTLRDALALEPRPNAEGIVVRFKETGFMLKIKQEDYVALHRIVTGLNERTVWERIGAGETVADICEALPDEFARWVEDVHLGLQFKADHVWYAVREAFEAILDKLHPAHERRAYAEAAAAYPEIRPYLFMMYDDKDCRPAIWRSLKPSGATKLRSVDEATA